MKDLFKFAESDEEHWISVSDLMAVLMMVFLLVAIVFQDHFQAIYDDFTKAEEKEKKQEEIIIGQEEDIEKLEKIIKKLREVNFILINQEDGAKQVLREFEDIKVLLIEFENIEKELRERLNKEFKNDFREWNAELDEDKLIIRFNDPKVFFEKKKVDLKQKFKDILKVFFPRYLKILNEKQFRDYVSEIRIEGHASSEYDCVDEKGRKRAPYYCNMTLSQGRTRAVLEFGLSETSVNRNEELEEWAKSLLTANGLSSSQLVCNDYDDEGKRIIASNCEDFGGEDREASRRVEFEIRTNFADEILKSLNEYRIKFVQ